MFSIPLEKALEERIKRSEQIVLLLNRRGYSTFMMCRACGYVAQCPQCDISLTYHMKTGHIRCHYCGYAERVQPYAPHVRASIFVILAQGHSGLKSNYANVFLVFASFGWI